MIITYNKRLTRLLLSVSLSLLLIVNPVLVRAVYAEELSQTSSDQKTTQTVETVTEPPSDIGAGNGSLTTDDPIENNTTPSVLETVSVESTGSTDETETNVAVVENDLDSESVTGQNTSVSSGGDAVVETGVALAEGVIDNEINSDAGIEETVEDALEVDVSPTPSPAESTEDVEELPETYETELKDVEGDGEENNFAIVDNSVDADSETGNNLLVAGDDAAVNTGEADSLVDVINNVNIDVENSDFDTVSLGIEGAGDIDLNEESKKLDGEVIDEVTSEEAALEGANGVSDNNFALVNNEITSIASTGSNDVFASGQTVVLTGDAQSLVNLVNLVNINLLDSDLFIGIVNIIDPLTGDLILPRPDGIITGVLSGNDGVADITTDVELSANTGGNVQVGEGGDNFMLTGDASSGALSFTLANLNIEGSYMFIFLINRFADWSGNLLNWSGPGEIQKQSENTALYTPGDFDVESEETVESEDSQRNFAVIDNKIKATSDTGNNTSSGTEDGSYMRTGDASSFSNVVNLVNLNLIKSKVFVGIVNIFTDWGGDVIVAHPDVTTSLSTMQGEVDKGGQFEVLLSYENKGSDLARDVWIEFEIPEGVEYLGSTSSLPEQNLGRKIIWSAGELKKGQNGSFNLKLRIGDDYSEEVSFWSFLVKEVRAAENVKMIDLIVNASIQTSDPDSDTTNNNSSVTTRVREKSEEGKTDQRQPVLEISAQNNVNVFVYPGDIVTFDIKITNKSDVPSYETRLVQNLYNGVPGSFGEAVFDLGTIAPGESGTLNFGLKLSEGLLEEGDYHTVAVAYGKAPNGNEVSSNESVTYFDIKFKILPAIVKEVSASDDEGIVLGDTDSCPLDEDDDEEILPYVLLLAVSTSYLTDWFRKKLLLIKE